MTNQFTSTVKSLFLMLRKDLSDSLKFVIIGYIAVIVFFSGIFIIGAYLGLPLIKLDGFYIVGLLFVGYLISGTAFTDLRNKEKTMFYLCLPVSVAVKFASVLLLCSAGVLISYTAVFYLFNSFAFLIGDSLFSLNVQFIDITNKDIVKYIGIYILTQPLFLIGAGSFKRVPAIITVAILFIVMIILFIYSSILDNFLLNDIFTNAGNNLKGFSPNYSINFLPMYFKGNLFFIISEYIVKFIIPVALWYVTYLKLKNKIAR